MSRTAIVAMTAAAGFGVVGYARSAYEESSHYMMVDEFVAAPRGDEVKLHGYVEPGSILRAGERVGLELHWRGKRVRVIGELASPACLRDGAEVVITGWLATAEDMAPIRGDELVVEASDVACKCAVRYDPGPPDRDTTTRFE